MLRTVIYGPDCITVLLDIIDCYSIIVKVNLKARGFTEFTSLTLPLQGCSIYHVRERVRYSVEDINLYLPES